MTTHLEFDATTNASAVAATFPSSVEGRTFLITGVSLGGIGRATAKALASQSPKILILTGRTKEKFSVRKALGEVLAYKGNIDVLINNAGIATIAERTLSEDGIEMQFATNHIGHFLFINLIMPKLAAAAKASSSGSVRVVNVASNGHLYSPVRFSDIDWEKTQNEIPKEEWLDYDSLKARVTTVSTTQPYIPMASYGASKTANILFTVSLDQKLKPLGIRSLAPHPGVIRTEIFRHMSREDGDETLKRLADS